MIIDEGIKRIERFENIMPLTKKEIEDALEYAVCKVRKNIPEFTHEFPSASSENGVYKATENHCWTTGFWTGILWWAYDYTKDDVFKKAAEIQCKSFKHRIENEIYVDHHDLGFLFELSCIKGYELTGNEEMKETAIKAANRLIKRYKEKGEFIQAWGNIDDPSAYRLIIDCMLNLPLLYWASEVTKDGKYADIASKHAKTAFSTVIREDASTHHTYYFDPETGRPKNGATHQGASDDSAWARGQAWGIYGFPLSYKYTKNDDYIKGSEKLINYFLNRLPEDYVCYWDLVYSDGDPQEKDSSAAAIAICGILELLKDKESKYSVYYKNAVSAILRSLNKNYTTRNTENSNGILMHGVYAKPQGIGIDECCIWGDYYYIEALVRLYRQMHMGLVAIV